MKDKKNIESAEKIFNVVQDYILLAKTQSKLKNPETLNRELEELAFEIKNLIDGIVEIY